MRGGRSRISLPLNQGYGPRMEMPLCSALFTENESSEAADARSIRYSRVKWACGAVYRSGATRSPIPGSGPWPAPE
jgi:hypothetical protein